MENNFLEIVQIIKQSRTNAIKAVNAELINLYWNVGAYISGRLSVNLISILKHWTGMSRKNMKIRVLVFCFVRTRIIR